MPAMSFISPGTMLENSIFRVNFCLCPVSVPILAKGDFDIAQEFLSRCGWRENNRLPFERLKDYADIP